MNISLNRIIADSINQNWDILALGDFEKNHFTYKEIAQNIKRYHLILDSLGVEKGEKVILLGRNSARWASAYLALFTYGAVVVPVLPDFKTEDFHYIIDHSDATLMIASESLFSTLDSAKIPNIKAVISMEDKGALHDVDGSLSKAVDLINNEEKFKEINKGEVKYDEIDNMGMGILSYTSGTTGFSKGVMIRRKSLLSNIVYARENMKLKSGDTICSFLPLAHIYGQLFEFLFPFTMGCTTTFLEKTPSPTILTKAFGEIKPNLILSVPLIIEKIYKKRLAPAINKPMIKIMLALPGLNKIVHKKVREQLTNTFGGEFEEIVVGAAALNAEVESFLRKINFRFTIGYGMTECAPLISYAGWRVSKFQSAGKIVDRMQVRIDSSDPYNEIGEIQVKGDNVMMGYYKNEEETSKSFTEDGWLKTGDLGVIDKDQYIYIKGRSKNMLLAANGKNIYPEELEARVNQLPIVGESVVIMDEGKLVALVFPDFDYMRTAGIKKEELSNSFEKARKEVNKLLPKFNQIQSFRLQEEEFEKTPKKNIKRFKYSG